MGFNCLDRCVKVAFLNGARLVPAPPVASRRPGVRYLHLHEGEEVDEARFADWLRQASAIDGARLF